MRLHTLPLLILVVVLFASPAAGAGAQEARPLPTPVPISVTRAWLQGNQERGDVKFRDGVVVEVEHLTEAVQQDKLNPHNLVLYLDGQAMKGLKVAGIEQPARPHGPSWLLFKLERTEGSDPIWRSLLGSPSWKQNYREVGVSVGFPDNEAIPQSTETYRPVIYLRVYDRWWAVVSFIFSILAIGAFLVMAKSGNVIRDSDPPSPPAGKQKPYSLALTQAAWWFFLVIGSFIFIYMITGDFNTMTSQALILMGIGTGTALGAFMINATKSDTANTKLSALRPEQAKLAAQVDQLSIKAAELKQRIASAGTTTPANQLLLRDNASALAEKQAKLAELKTPGPENPLVLRDNVLTLTENPPNPAPTTTATAEDQLALRDNAIALAENQAKLMEINKQIDDAQAGLSKPVSEGLKNDLLTDVNGIALHRFQMVIWTVVLGVIFLIDVYRNLAMPEFSGTLLALMGISAGTYLGFKIPERQTDANDVNKP